MRVRPTGPASTVKGADRVAPPAVTLTNVETVLSVGSGVIGKETDAAPAGAIPFSALITTEGLPLETRNSRPPAGAGRLKVRVAIIVSPPRIESRSNDKW